MPWSCKVLNTFMTQVWTSQVVKTGDNTVSDTYCECSHAATEGHGDETSGPLGAGLAPDSAQGSSQPESPELGSDT